MFMPFDWVDSYRLRNATYENTPTFSLSGLRCRGRVLRVYDGDTLWLAIVHPGKTVYKYRVRMYGYDAPEMHPRTDTENRDQVVESALRAKAYLETLLSQHPFVEVEFFDFDKYGRPLVKLTLPGQPRTVNDCMLAEGFVNVYYGGTKSKPPMTNALPLNHSNPSE